MGLKQYQPEIKPREKAKKYGIEALSYQELIAIILRTGNKDKHVLDLSNEVLLNFDNLFELKTATIEELKEIEGIGPAKAIEIQAAIELGKRLTIEERQKKGQILSSVDLAEQLILEMKDYEQEHFMVLYLNAKNEVIKKKTLFIGSLNQSVAHPREIFKIAVKTSTARMIMVHNHPSGNPNPSKQDIAFTERIVECGRLMGIDILDHLIIGENSYISLKEEGII
ncbi:RadC family protein [Vagococcus fluvialis]|uniref:RadC family protein n=1 Tax=Vagococcus fluvialis TaxID=2738 RepID=UPI001D0A5C58|nr:DNA repair protein RadC [Vagococcus fluvialis]UDM75513.1 DNA repair protein RadC [Vagococcus fluvialis]